MAFNWNVFWTRAFTALVFVAVMLAGLLYSEWSFFILFSLLHFGCWHEYLMLMEKIYKHSFHAYTKIGISLLGFHVFLNFCNGLKLGPYLVRESFAVPILVVGVVFFVWGIFKQTTSIKQIGYTVLGVFYISLPMGLLLYLRYSGAQFPIIPEQGRLAVENAGFYLPLLIIAAIWVNDTMAYLVGSAIGRTPFSKISPKKTLEGTLGGIICCVAAVTLILQPFFDWHYLLGISLVAALVGTGGDLLESKLKRMAGVKDSGTLLRGHGGFLDRFDSLLLAIPAVWILLVLAG
ncbi:MAG: phosphatidate cytidylyltransferase [Niabella sp.]